MTLHSFLPVILCIITCTFSLSQCKTTKIQWTRAPHFTLTECTSQSWVGGVPGVSGINVQLFLTKADGVEPDSLYFRKRVSPIELKPTKQGILWVAYFKNKTAKDDRQMHSEPAYEYGNPIPEKTNFPFDLKKNEAVLRYTYEGKVYHYKITDIIEKKPVAYPTAKPER